MELADARWTERVILWTVRCRECGREYEIEAPLVDRNRVYCECGRSDAGADICRRLNLRSPS